jgi:hypothetical protein
MIDPQLASYATVRELEYLEALDKHGTQKGAARALKVADTSLREAMKRLKARAASKGYSPEHSMTKTVPDGFKVKGVSTYYDEEGKARGQWVKSSADDERRELAIREAFAAMAQDLPRLFPIPSNGQHEQHLASLYTLTDSHVGMLAWAKEGGDDWDLNIAEATLVGCFAQMVNASPPATVGFVNQLGDFLHYDSAVAPVTPLHGHVLDSDGRFSKMVSTAVRILRRVIDLALAKHAKVVVLMAEGNHDLASSVWLRVMFRALYENEPRVEVIESELPYYAYKHGKTLLAFHHGHLKKNDQLPILFASQFPQAWGETTKRYAHCGHRHHAEEKEHSGMTVIQHPTLAARDAYAARGGWIAERAVTAITYHSEYGQVARHTVTPEMLQPIPGTTHPESGTP